jgi:hypothetical protein
MGVMVTQPAQSLSRNPSTPFSLTSRVLVLRRAARRAARAAHPDLWVVMPWCSLAQRGAPAPPPLPVAALGGGQALVAGRHPSRLR